MKNLHRPVEQIVDADVIIRSLFRFQVGRNADDVSDEDQQPFDQQALLFLPFLPFSIEKTNELLRETGEEGSVVGEKLLVRLQVGSDLQEVHAQFFVLGRFVIETQSGRLGLSGDQ